MCSNYDATLRRQAKRRMTLVLGIREYQTEQMCVARGNRKPVTATYKKQRSRRRRGLRKALKKYNAVISAVSQHVLGLTNYLQNTELLPHSMTKSSARVTARQTLINMRFQMRFLEDGCSERPVLVERSNKNHLHDEGRRN